MRRSSNFNVDDGVGGKRVRVGAGRTRLFVNAESAFHRQGRSAEAWHYVFLGYLIFLSFHQRYFGYEIVC